MYIKIQDYSVFLLDCKASNVIESGCRNVCLYIFRSEGVFWHLLVKVCHATSCMTKDIASIGVFQADHMTLPSESHQQFF